LALVLLCWALSLPGQATALTIAKLRADGTDYKSTGIKGMPAAWTSDGKKVILTINAPGKKYSNQVKATVALVQFFVDLLHPGAATN